MTALGRRPAANWEDHVRLEVHRGVGWPGWEAVLALRHEVFGVEQGIAGTTVNDPDDEDGIHAVVWQRAPRSGEPPVLVGMGRLTLSHRRRDEALIAWVATAAPYRQHGVGRVVMRALLNEADRAGIVETVLAAQTHAESFYRGLGFRPTGAPYDMRGIPHRWMIRSRW